jgi:hypothetical protein
MSYLNPFTEHDRGKKGTWMFNNRLLQDEEYIKIVKDCIAEVIGQYKTEDNENMLTFSSLIFSNSDSNSEISSSCVPPF